MSLSGLPDDAAGEYSDISPAWSGIAVQSSSPLQDAIVARRLTGHWIIAGLGAVLSDRYSPALRYVDHAGKDVLNSFILPGKPLQERRS